MSKDYKQWKKILADPKLLKIEAVILLVLGSLFFTMIFNFLKLFISQSLLSLSIIQETKNFATTAFHLSDYLNYKLMFPWFQNGPFYIVGWIFIQLWWVWYVAKLIYKQRIAFRDINTYSHGEQRWTTISEIKEQYKAVPLNNEKYEGKCGEPIIVIDDIVYIDDSNTNSEIIGGTQSGKTQLKTYPMLDLHSRAMEQDSGVVIDVKGDMLRRSYQVFKDNGFDVKCLNLIEPDNGIGYNPFREIQVAYKENRIDDAAKMTHSFAYSLYHSIEAKEPVWENTAIAMFNACIIALADLLHRNGKIQLLTFYAFVNMLVELSEKDEDDRLLLDVFFESLPSDSIARQQYLPVGIAQDVTKSSIMMNATSQLTKFILPEIARLTCGEGFDMRDMVNADKPIMLFICIPDWDMSNGILVSSFLSQLGQVLAREATLISKNNKLPRRVIQYMEELGNIPPIEGLAQQMNVGLERGIISRIFLQSEVQLAEKNGDKQSEAILNACGNQTLIMSDSEKDFEKFEKKLGNTTKIVTTRHGSPDSLDKSYGEQETKVPLMSRDKLSNLKKGEVVLSRSKTRTDLKGQDIVSYPIYANKEEGTALKFAYTYLFDRFKSDCSLSEMDLGDGHAEINLKKYVVKMSISKEKIGGTKETPSMQKYDDKLYDTQSDYYREGDSFMSDSISQLSFKKTLIKGNVTNDELRIFYGQAENLCSPEEIRILKQFKYIEEINDFLNQESRALLKKKIGYLFEGKVDD